MIIIWRNRCDTYLFNKHYVAGYKGKNQFTPNTTTMESQERVKMNTGKRELVLIPLKRWFSAGLGMIVLKAFSCNPGADLILVPVMYNVAAQSKQKESCVMCIFSLH